MIPSQVEDQADLYITFTENKSRREVKCIFLPQNSESRFLCNLVNVGIRKPQQETLQQHQTNLLIITGDIIRKQSMLLPKSFILNKPQDFHL